MLELTSKSLLFNLQETGLDQAKIYLAFIQTLESCNGVAITQDA